MGYRTAYLPANTWYVRNNDRARRVNTTIHLSVGSD